MYIFIGHTINISQWLPVSAFYSGQHQIMHYFELNKTHTHFLM